MNVLENGLDSFTKSITLVNELHIKKEHEDYKYILKEAILSLHHSTEVLFKYLIKKKSKYFLYSDLKVIFEKEALNKSSNKAKELRTIGFLDAIHRVIVLYDLKLSNKEYQRFKFLNDVRNALTHFEWEFEDVLTEHTIAMMLPTLFGIYSKNINTFDSHINKEFIYSNIKNAVNYSEIWNLKKLLELDRKIDKSLNIIKRLDDNPELKNEIFTDNKSDFERIRCPLCEKERFKVKSSIVLGNNNFESLGTCDYCNLEINNENAQFKCVNDNYYNKIDTWIRLSSNDAIKRLLSSKESLDEIYGEEYKALESIISKYSAELYKYVRSILMWKINDIDELLASKYYEDDIYFHNDRVENIVENENGKIDLCNIELYEMYRKEKDFIDAMRDFKIFIENYLKISNVEIMEIYDDLEERGYSYSYHHAMHVGWNGEVDSEITIRVDFNLESFIKELEGISL